MKTSLECLPQECLRNPTWLGLSYFGRDMAIYAAALFALAWTDDLLLLPLLWLLAALGISALFVVGHDAAHEALFRTPRLCYLVGQAAFLPSLHAYGAWVEGHNRIHHGHTGCRDVDFVWHPLTPEQYDALPRRGRLLHRVEWSAWGAGLYYARAVWWKKMMRAAVPRRRERATRRDRFVVLGFFALLGAGLLYVGYARYGNVAGAAWTWVKVFAIPWLLWNQIVGAVVYLHHTGPDSRWFPRDGWKREDPHVDGTVSYRLPRWLNYFWHNIFLHVPHHLAPRVPFYHLPEASRALAASGRCAATVRRIRLRDYVAITRTCKVYDFERGLWLNYRGKPARVPPAPRVGR